MHAPHHGGWRGRVTLPCPAWPQALRALHFFASWHAGGTLEILAVGFLVPGKLLEMAYMIERCLEILVLGKKCPSALLLPCFLRGVKAAQPSGLRLRVRPPEQGGWRTGRELLQSLERWQEQRAAHGRCLVPPGCLILSWWLLGAAWGTARARPAPYRRDQAQPRSCPCSQSWGGRGREEKG